ncbi:outer membrane protein assembly factor BamB family protein [Microlunatus endophyticus]|nr:PQQ-binding-like beta-propeller repeat protein [Microlunatus endophyticus]
MITAPAGLSAGRRLGTLRIGLATFQPAVGTIALSCSVEALTDTVTTRPSDPARWPLWVAALVGAALLAVWAVARERRDWMIVSAILSALLAVGMILLTALALRTARLDPSHGIWSIGWLGTTAVLLWILAALAALVERRSARTMPIDWPPVWATASAVVLPLALAAASVLLIIQMAAWEIHANSATSAAVVASQAQPSELSGQARWSVDVGIDDSARAGAAISTTAGLAVAVGADRDHSAGVIMIDPVSGRTRWRYELHGAQLAPVIEAPDQGREVMIDFDETELSREIPHRVITLAAENGKITALRSGNLAEPSDDGPPEQLLVGKGFDIEFTASGVLRRLDLRTGKTDWSARLPCADKVRASAATQTIFVDDCADGDHPEMILAYDLSSGRLLWQRREQNTLITALAAIDDRRAMALTMGKSGNEPTCRAVLVGSTTERPLETFVGSNRRTNPLAPYGLDPWGCQDSSIHDVAGSVILQLALTTPRAAHSMPTTASSGSPDPPVIRSEPRGKRSWNSKAGPAR